MNVVELLRTQARDRPDAAALIAARRGGYVVTTFAELDDQAARAAALLEDAGLRRGDDVLLLLPMSAELYVALGALWRLGLVATFLDPSAGRDHVERCCALARPRGLIASVKAHLLRLVVPALRAIPHKFSVGWPLPGALAWSRGAQMPPRAAIEPCVDEAPALRTFTTGSTGTPRAAVRTHGFLQAQHRALTEVRRLGPDDVDLCTLPIVLLTNLAAGVRSVLADADLRRPGLIDPAPVVQQMRRHGVTSAAASPAFFERLVAYGLQHGITLPTLRTAYSGGAPVLPRLLDQLKGLAPNAEPVAVYGSTEAEPIAQTSLSAMTPDDRHAMAGGAGLLAGRPVASIALRIVRMPWGRAVGPWTDAEFAAACAATGEPGEIVVSGAHVLTGAPAEADGDPTKVRVGAAVWHRTGDAGTLDAAGRLWLLGRGVARIADARGTLYPFAVETAAAEHPGVDRCALAASAGRRVLALQGRFERGDLDRLAAELAWARLDELRIVRAIPVDARHNAKVDYPRLHELLARSRA